MKAFCVFCIVAVMYFVTFPLAGLTAYAWLEWIQRSNQEYVHADFGANAFLSIFSPILMLIFIGISRLTLMWADMPRGYIIPVWITSVACVVALLTLAGESAVRLYFNGFLWLILAILLAVAFYVYLLWQYHRDVVPDEPVDLCWGTNDIIVVCVVTPLSAMTFWIAGAIAWVIKGGMEDIAIAGQPNSPLDYLLTVTVLAIVALVFAGIAWLILPLGKIQRWSIMPVWGVTFVATVALLTFAVEHPMNDWERDHWWILAALGFFAYLCSRPWRVDSLSHRVSLAANSYFRRVLVARRRKFPPRRTRNRK